MDLQQIGHYRLQQPLGQGGMGVVYLAEDQNLPRLVALKMIRSDIHPVELPKALRLFNREAQAIAQLKHLHILPLYDYNTVDVQGAQVPYMVMPFCQDGSLEAWLSITPRLSLQVIASVILQVADALQYAHEKQIIHRDVKPGNILLEQRKGTFLPHVYLTDFGIAAIMDGATSTGQVIRGSLPYMAPEQLEGRPTFVTDQYALAVTAYQLLTGKMPLGGNPPLPSAVNPVLSQQVDMVILRGLAKQPTDRFPSVLAFAEALRDALQHDSLALTYPAASNNHSTAPSSGRTTFADSHPQPSPLILPTPLPSMTASAKPMPTPTIDGKEVLDRVQGKNIPSSWRVCYPAYSGGLWRVISGGGCRAYLCYFITGVITAACSASIANLIGWNLAGLPLGVLIILYVFSMLIAYSKQVLVFMPNGLVLHTWNWPFPWKETRAIDYRVIEGMRVDSKPFLGFVTLTFKRTDGATDMKTRVDRSFGDVDMTLKAISNAYNQFMGNTSAPSSIGITLFTYCGHSHIVCDVAWSPDGKRIVSGSADKTVQIWEALSGEQRATYRSHSGAVTAVVWSPDNTRIASGSTDGKARVWDVATGYNTLTYSGHFICMDIVYISIRGVSWSPDNTRMASVSMDGTIRIWNAASGKGIVKCRTPSVSLFSDTFWATVRWSPDGTHLASAICLYGKGTGVQIWTANGEHIYTYTGHSKGVAAVAWSPNGMRIASASKDGTVHVWDVVNGGNVYCYQGHSDWVTGVAWSPDGMRIASASKDRTVHVWNAADGSNVCCYNSHTAWVNAVAWSPDGTRLASASDDKTVHIWRTA